MNDQELGAYLIPPEGPEAEVLGRMLLPCAVPGQLTQFVAPIPDTFFPSLARRVGGRSDHRDTVNRFCRTNPLEWCVEQFASGQCVRAIEWWRRRVDRTVAAVGCGCDPTTCATCSAPGRTPGQCSACQETTGWELTHIEELRALKGMLDAS